MTRKSFWIAVCILTAVSTLYIFAGAGNGSLENSDDGNIAWLIREMSQGRSLLDFSFQGGVEHSRPLFFYWIEAGLVRLFGSSEFVLRLFPSLSFLGLALTVFLVTYRLTERIDGALFAAVSLLILYLPLRVSRRVGEDMTLSFFLAAAMYFHVCAAERGKKWISWGWMVALALFTKGPVGAIAFLPAGVDLILFRRGALRSRWPYLGFLCASVLIAPWAALSTYRLGADYWKDSIAVHVFQRAASPFHGTTDFFYYVRSFANHDPLFLWTTGIGLALFVAAMVRKKVSLRQLSPVGFNFLIPVLLFSFAKTRFERYMLPAYAPMAILVAIGFCTWIPKKKVLLALASVCFGIGIFMRQDDLFHPDYAPEMKSLALQSKFHLLENDPLYVYDVYYTAAAFYSERRTILITGDHKFYQDLTESSPLLGRSQTVQYVDRNELAGLPLQHTSFCCLSPMSRTSMLIQLLKKKLPSNISLEVYRDRGMDLTCLKRPHPGM